MAEDTNDRKGIISAIDKPIRLAALVVLVVEALLAYLLSKAKEEDIKFYVITMVGVLILTLIMAFLVEWKRVSMKGNISVPAIGTVEKQAKEFKWDVFLAAPMAAIETDEKFSAAMGKMNELLTVLETECQFKRIFFAGKGMKTKKEFDNAGLSVKEDTETIRDSRLFILVYPDKIVSSVLFEAGIALAYGKPSFYFGKEFPFLMTEANNVYKHVKIHEAHSIDEVIAAVRKNKQTLFNVEL